MNRLGILSRSYALAGVVHTVSTRASLYSLTLLYIISILIAEVPVLSKFMSPDTDYSAGESMMLRIYRNEHR